MGLPNLALVWHPLKIGCQRIDLLHLPTVLSMVVILNIGIASLEIRAPAADLAIPRFKMTPCDKRVGRCSQAISSGKQRMQLYKMWVCGLQGWQIVWLYRISKQHQESFSGDLGTALCGIWDARCAYTSITNTAILVIIFGIATFFFPESARCKQRLLKGQDTDCQHQIPMQYIVLPLQSVCVEANTFQDACAILFINFFCLNWFH
jgi:hypothetical protein